MSTATNAFIRTNIPFQNALRHLNLLSNEQASIFQRLSGGLRINSAADDAAGLGISTMMRAQIRSLDQASRNAQDGISLLQTAEGALDTINEMLIRVRELVIQAANDTNIGGTGAHSDRLRIQDEIDHLMAEIDSIVTRTHFNTRTLLDGSLSSEGAIQGGEWIATQQSRTITPARITTLDQFLRMTAGTPFEGSFEELIRLVGANTEGRDVEEWISINGGLAGLENALNTAMAGRWGDNLRVTTGLVYNNARDLLDDFIAGSGFAGSWAEFVADPNNATFTASTFSRLVTSSASSGMSMVTVNETFEGRLADIFLEIDPNADVSHYVTLALGGVGFYDTLNMFMSTRGGPDNINIAGRTFNVTELIDAFTAGAGLSDPNLISSSTVSRIEGEETTQVSGGNSLAIYQVLRSQGFEGLNENSSFADVRNVFYKLAGWGIGTFSEDIAQTLAPWLEARFGDGLHYREAWDTFVRTYLLAETEIVEVDRWQPAESSRQRGAPLWLQIGANSGQGIRVEIGNMSTGALFGREGANHSTERRIIDVLDLHGYNVQDGIGSNFGSTIGGNRAANLIDAVDSAIKIATRQRSALGAVQNRLEFTVQSLDIASENLQASMSRISDAEMAREIMRLARINILQQAAISMMVQANQTTQNVLVLLQ